MKREVIVNGSTPLHAIDRVAHRERWVPDDVGDRFGYVDPVALTGNQRAVVNLAVQLVRLHLQDPSVSEGRALELICADFLSDPNWHPPIQEREEHAVTTPPAVEE